MMAWCLTINATFSEFSPVNSHTSSTWLLILVTIPQDPLQTPSPALIFWKTITGHPTFNSNLCRGSPEEFKHPVTTLFLLLLLLWTLELYLILSYRYEDLLISWSYRSYLDDLILAILSWRSYLDLLILSSIDDPRYVSFTLLLTCIQHAFDSCLSLTIDMHSTHVAAQQAFTICFTCVCLEDNAWTLVYNRS